jgi:hypothetical protein
MLAKAMAVTALEELKIGVIFVNFLVKNVLPYT